MTTNTALLTLTIALMHRSKHSHEHCRLTANCPFSSFILPHTSFISSLLFSSLLSPQYRSNHSVCTAHAPHFFFASVICSNTSADEAKAGSAAAVDVSSSSSSSSKSVTGAGGEDGSNKNSDTGTANEGQSRSSAIETPSADSVLITAVGDGSEEGTPGQPAASGDDAASNIEGEGNAEGRESGTAFGEGAATSDEVDPEAQAATAAAAAAALEAESARIRKNAARARKKAGGTASSDDLITRAVFDELKQQFWDSSTVSAACVPAFVPAVVPAVVPASVCACSAVYVGVDGWLAGNVPQSVQAQAEDAQTHIHSPLPMCYFSLTFSLFFSSACRATSRRIRLELT